MSHTSHALRQLEAIRTELDNLTKPVLDDIERRGRHTTRPDGYPARTLSDGTSRGTNALTGLESAANRRGFAGTGSAATQDAVGQLEHDPTGEAIRELFDAIDRAARAIATASARRRYILNVQHAANRKPPTGAGVCGACRRDVPGTPDDRLRNGYCHACNTAWNRDGRPERTPWETKRRAELTQPQASGNTRTSTSQPPSTNPVTTADTLSVNVGAVGQ